MRIVSLHPASTEWVAAFGAVDDLVGRSHACDYPPAVRHLPVVSACVLADAASSAQLDEAVRAHAAEGRRLYALRDELLVELRPDIILTQSLCDACCISERDVHETVSGWADEPPICVAMGPTTFKEVLDAALRLGKAIGRVREAMKFIGEAEKGLREMQLQLGLGKRAGPSKLPTVACIEWLDPVMTAGHWVPSLVKLAGGRVLAAEEGAPSAYVDWSAIVQADPDVLAIMPCGFDLEAIRRELETLVRRPGWNRLRAVREGRVVAFDGNAFFNRPGPRLYRAVELLAAALHPEEYVMQAEDWEMEAIRT